MELVGYRENLELLRELFPDRATIDFAECSECLGCDIRTVRAAAQRSHNPLPTVKVGKKRVLVPIPRLARWMCQR